MKSNPINANAMQFNTMKPFWFLLTGSALLIACSDQPDRPASDAASNFYQAYLLTAATGVPTAAQREQLAPLLSPSLLSLLSQAEAAERRYALMHNNSVPPLAQGDLFSSLFEGATGANVHACKQQAERAACQIVLAFEPPGAQPAHWQDILHLVWRDDSWRIDDLEYGGNWPFGNKGSLRDTLQQLIQRGESAKPIEQVVTVVSEGGVSDATQTTPAPPGSIESASPPQPAPAPLPNESTTEPTQTEPTQPTRPNGQRGQ